MQGFAPKLTSHLHPCPLQGAPGNRGEPGPAGETGDEVSSLHVMPLHVLGGHPHPLTTPLVSPQGALGEDGPPGEQVSESASAQGSCWFPLAEEEGA